MDTKREFDELTLNITTGFTQRCWQRLQRILAFHGNNIRKLNLTSTDSRLETNRMLVDTLWLLPENQIKEIEFKNINLATMGSFLQRQNSIKKLTIIGTVELAFPFDLPLIYLRLVGPRCESLVNIIQSVTNLRSLSISTDEITRIDDETFETISNLELLERLDVPINDVRSIESIQRLQNLKSLSVSLMVSQIYTLSKLKMSKLKELELVTLDHFNSSEVFEKLCINFSNISSLKVRGRMAISCMENFPTYFKCLESLLIENLEFIYVHYLRFLECNFSDQHKMLKSLVILNNDRKIVMCANDCMRFILLFPNIEILVMSKFLQPHNYNLECLLKRLSNLKELVVESNNLTSTSGAMEIIKKFGVKLKFVLFRNWSFEFDAENLKKYFDYQFTTIKRTDGHLILKAYNTNCTIKDIHY